MSDFVQQATAFVPKQSLSWLSSFQQSQKAIWNNAVFPTRKTEDWKYTNLKMLEKGGYFSGEPSPSLGAESLDEIKAQIGVEGFESFDLVFVNGVLQASLSSEQSVLPEGVSVTAFSQANPDQQTVIAQALGSVAKDDKHLFVTLNNSLLSEGVLVHVEKNVVVDKPVRVVNISTKDDHAFSVNPRLLVRLESGSQATVVEHFVGNDDAHNSFVNAVSELDVQANARLYHYRLHLEHETLAHIGAVHADLHRDAVLNSFHLALGGQLKRIDIVVNHRGAGAHCELNGVYLPRAKQQVDYHTCIEHAVPLCTTNEVFRGIVADEARAVFNGRIHIHKDAQKTLAQLSNKNLLTSKKAEVYTKPELEIYADDVQCAHGATVAQLDENSLHYLKTRGVAEDEARVMLSFGFINELINQIHHKEIANYLRPMMATLFARDPELLRHIAS